MEPLKIITIGQYENEMLTIYRSIINFDMYNVLANFDQDIDANAIPFVLNLLIGEGHTARTLDYEYEFKFPFLKNISEVDEVENVLQAIQNFSKSTKNEKIQKDGLLWFFKGKLIWTNRPARNKDDYHLICLRIEEHVFSEDDEILRLKKRVSRIRRIIDKDFQKIKRRQIDDDILAFVLQRDKNCSRCGAEEELQFDHILPVSKGGNDEPENLRILCMTCNSSRGNLENY